MTGIGLQVATTSIFLYPIRFGILVKNNNLTLVLLNKIYLNLLEGWTQCD